jgi:hypothetical protein
MPRRRRHVRPHALIHVIARFLNREYLLESDEERSEYLRRAGLCFGESDWRVVSYALMGTHTHFGAIAGFLPFAAISRRLHAGFAQWLNLRRGRLGPIIATRPTTKEVPLTAARYLIAYHHNNPVRAGVVRRASESAWTSHRYYCGEPAPPWLDVALGLQLAESAQDRREFLEFVDTVGGTDYRALSDPDFARTRKRVRSQLGPSVELSSPRLADDGGEVAEIWTTRDAVIRSSWRGDLLDALAEVSRAAGVGFETLRSRSRVRDVVRGRRLAVLCCHSILDRPLTEVAAALGVSATAARRLERSASREDWAVARVLADGVASRRIDS